MKLNIVNNNISSNSIDIKKYQTANNVTKSNLDFLKDKINISNTATQIIQSIDNRKVELQYSIHSKDISAFIIDKAGAKIEVKKENLPSDLKKISSTNIFNSFFKNTYAKVSVLSDGDYKFSINHKLLGGNKDEPEGSMTPRTQGKRYNPEKQLNFNAEYVKNTVQNLNDSITEIKKGLNPIIDKAIEKTVKDIASLKDNGCVFSQDYQKGIRSKNLLSFNDIINTSPSVKRFGMYSESLIHLVESPLEKHKLHDIEKTLFEDAAIFLKESLSAEEYIVKNILQYANNVVLVDIFVRENNKIKEDKNTGKPETHTVALWKKKEREYLLIDPSKVDFSKDLAIEIKNQMKVDDIKVHSPTGNILYGTGGGLTGYNELQSTSIEKHLHRDCVDIAAKIGFEINELQINPNINKLGEIESGLNLQISNQKKVATYLINNYDGKPNRKLQSTEFFIRRSNRDILESIVK